MEKKNYAERSFKYRELNMQAILKQIHAADADIVLTKYQPEDPDFFDLDLCLLIGVSDKEGADIFYLTICTPKWFDEQNFKAPVRGYLLVDCFNLDQIKTKIQHCIEQASGNSWHEIANQINQFAIWEFDNYQ